MRALMTRGPSLVGPGQCGRFAIECDPPREGAGDAQRHPVTEPRQAQRSGARVFSGSGLEGAQRFGTTGKTIYL